jgi:hypothetical protein
VRSVPQPPPASTAAHGFGPEAGSHITAVVQLGWQVIDVHSPLGSPESGLLGMRVPQQRYPGPELVQSAVSSQKYLYEVTGHAVLVLQEVAPSTLSTQHTLPGVFVSRWRPPVFGSPGGRPGFRGTMAQSSFTAFWPPKRLLPSLGATVVGRFALRGRLATDHRLWLVLGYQHPSRRPGRTRRIRKPAPPWHRRR